MQRAFAWEDCHLYAFQTRTATYAGFDEFGASGDLLAEDHTLAALARPEHEERMEWVEEGFDPEPVDLAATDRRLRRTDGDDRGA